MTPEYRTKLKAIEWTDSQTVVASLLKAFQLHDTVLADLILDRVHALLLFEKDALTANLVLMYKDYLLGLDSNLTPQLVQLEIDTDRVNKLIYLRMLRQKKMKSKLDFIP